MRKKDDDDESRRAAAELYWLAQAAALLRLHREGGLVEGAVLTPAKEDHDAVARDHPALVRRATPYLKLPLVRRARVYKTPHWLPIVFNLPDPVVTRTRRRAPKPRIERTPPAV
jgi:hypothetical protein